MTPSELVRRDRVHRSVYSDPAIFALEMERIFARAWVFVGHASQVPNKGDFVTTVIGRHPVILSRHHDGRIYVVRNSCGHRGAIVCNRPSGNADLFRCCYHGWTFKLNGDLDAISMPRGYGDALNLDDPALGMGRVPRVGVYRGFVFASLAPEGADFENYLGPNRAAIDELCDRAPDGEVELTGGVHKYLFRGNWKLQLENTVDMYHVPFSHASTLRPDGRQFGRRRGDDAGARISSTGAAAAKWERRVAWASPAWGHSYTGSQDIAEGNRDDEVYREYRARLEARHGRDRAAEIMHPRRHNSVFYPSMSLQALNTHVRVIRPVAVDRTEVWVYPVKLKGAPEALNRNFIRHLNLTHSAASLIQTDDLECFRRCQDGVAAKNDDWVLFARGIESETLDNDGNISSQGTVELPQRAQFSAWARYMGADRFVGNE